MQGTRADRRAGIWTDKDSAGHNDIYAAWARSLCTGMETHLRNAQSPEVMAKRKGNSVIIGRKRQLHSNERMKKPINEG